MTKSFKSVSFSLLFSLSCLFFCHSAQAQVNNGVNISLWNKVSTQPNTTGGSTIVNIGLVSTVYQLKGLSINIFGETAKSSSKGIQIAGLYNVVNGDFTGIQIGGITNVNAGRLKGLDASLMMNILGDRSSGIAIAGLGNITGRDFTGLAISGLTTIASDGFKGISISGLGSITSGRHSGVNISGLLNVTGMGSEGILLSGIGNIATGSYHGLNIGGVATVTGGDLYGLQLSSLGNITFGEMKGAQIGAVNVAAKGKGLQFGLINYYQDDFDGLQLGLINLNPRTRTEVMIGSGTANILDIGFRFKNSWNYTILGIGTGNYKLKGMDMSFSYRAGILYPLNEELTLSGDLGFSHIDNFTNKAGRTNRVYDLSARMNLEYCMSDLITGFVSLGYSRSNDYHGHKFRQGIIAGAGLFINISDN